MRLHNLAEFMLAIAVAGDEGALRPMDAFAADRGVDTLGLETPPPACKGF